MQSRWIYVLVIAGLAAWVGCDADHSPTALCDHLEAESPSRAVERDECIRDKEALRQSLSAEAYEEFASCWMSASTELDFFACAQDARGGSQP